MLPLEFYRRQDVVAIAKDLIGAFLFTRIDGVQTGGMIIETEAYGGVTDRASHAYGGRRTERTEVMYRAGGVAYVYFCYGMHTLFNIVTNEEDVPHAVLIRSILPTVGIDSMQRRRKGRFPLAEGPARLCQALGITLECNGRSLNSSSLWIEPSKASLDCRIEATPRIGIDYAGKDALLPWRYLLRAKEGLSMK